jgi:hypothetical protein
MLRQAAKKMHSGITDTDLWARLHVRFVEATHDEAHNCLCDETRNHGPFWPQVVNDECADNGPRHIEQAEEETHVGRGCEQKEKDGALDDDVPAENNYQVWRTAGDTTNGLEEEKIRKEPSHLSTMMEEYIPNLVVLKWSERERNE